MCVHVWPVSVKSECSKRSVCVHHVTAWDPLHVLWCRHSKQEGCGLCHVHQESCLGYLYLQGSECMNSIYVYTCMVWKPLSIAVILTTSSGCATPCQSSLYSHCHRKSNDVIASHFISKVLTYTVLRSLTDIHSTSLMDHATNF